MRNNIWLAIALVMISPAMLFTASCGKKVLQSEAVPMTQSKVPEVSERSAEEAEQARRLREDRLWAEAASREAAAEEFVKKNIQFSFDSSVLSDEAQQILMSKAEYLRTNLGVTVTVEGHCDERGTYAYNKALGDRRAVSVKNFLINRGISPVRLNTISYGEQRPIALGKNEESWAKNRRAQFVIN